MPAGATLWSALGNASGALTLANAGNATTFNQTSAVTWTWANTTAASSGTSQSSPLLSLNGKYWDGAASQTDSWTIENVIANGTNGSSTLTLLHSGSTGAAGLQIPNKLLIAGTTSGTSTFTANATAGTANNAVTMSNVIGGPSGTRGAATYGFTSAANSGMYVGTGVAITHGGNGVASFQQASNKGIRLWSGGGFQWTTSANDPDGGTVDTSFSRLGAASVALGSGNASDVTGTLTLATLVLQTANAATWTRGQSSELLTLSTSGTTTDTAGNLLPANSIIEAVVARVTTSITTATTWQLGDATTNNRFTAANSTMTSGTTDIGLRHYQGSISTDAAGPVQTAAAKVRVTTTGTPGAGVIRITVFYRQFVAPTS
jgi:hypothetical protein